MPEPGRRPVRAVLGQVESSIEAVDGSVPQPLPNQTNAYLQNAQGKSILVTQAFSASTAYADIELTIDLFSRDVVESSAAVITTYADDGPGLTPDAEVAALVKAAEDAVAPLISRVVGVAAADITRAQNSAGESALGNLIADAQRAAMGTDFAFMNPGGIRADISAGDVTWGELFTVQPFGNSLVRMDLTGAQIVALLEQQWEGQPFARIMQLSGLRVQWDPNAPVGSRVVTVARAGGTPLDPSATYSVTCNSFMASGGDNFTVFVSGQNVVGGPVDLDALLEYLASRTQPFSSSIEGRITTLP